MTDIAIISAAGWKGAGHLSGLAHVPEALLPLGDGTTVVSRLALQLKALGFISLVGLGRPGSLCPRTAYYLTVGNPRRERFIPEEVAQVGRTVSPWTWEGLEQVARFAIPFIVPVPERGNRHDTACVALGAIGYRSWERLFLVSGDFMFTDALLRDIMSYPCPCQIQMPSAGHIALLLDPAGARIYCETVETHRGFRQPTPEAELERAGIPLMKVDGERSDEWLDVDYGGCHQGAMDRIAKKPVWQLGASGEGMNGIHQPRRAN